MSPVSRRPDLRTCVALAAGAMFLAAAAVAIQQGAGAQSPSPREEPQSGLFQQSEPAPTPATPTLSDDEAFALAEADSRLASQLSAAFVREATPLFGLKPDATCPSGNCILLSYYDYGSSRTFQVYVDVHSRSVVDVIADVPGVTMELTPDEAQRAQAIANGHPLVLSAQAGYSDWQVNLVMLAHNQSGCEATRCAMVNYITPERAFTYPLYAVVDLGEDDVMLVRTPLP